MLLKLFLLPLRIVGMFLKLLRGIVSAILHLIFSRILGAVFGVVIGLLLGIRHLGIRIFPGSKKKKK